MPSYKPVKTLLSSADTLKPLLGHARRLETLTQALRASIDPALSEHIALANLKHKTAVVSADSPAWLATIRYLSPTILETLQRQPGLEHIAEVQYIVLPAADSASQQPVLATRHASLSSKSAQFLASAASGIEDPDIADALKRLSANAHKPATDKS